MYMMAFFCCKSTVDIINLLSCKKIARETGMVAYLELLCSQSRETQVLQLTPNPHYHHPQPKSGRKPNLLEADQQQFEM